MSIQTLEQELAARDRLYKPPVKKAEIVDVPAMDFLQVDGIRQPFVRPPKPD